MTVAITRHAYSAEQLRVEAARGSDGKVARRMLALAHVLEGMPRWRAAALCGIDRQTLRDWVHRYNQAGLAGLQDRPAAGGPACKLSEAQQAEFAGWVKLARTGRRTRLCVGGGGTCNDGSRRALGSACMNAASANCWRG